MIVIGNVSLTLTTRNGVITRVPHPEDIHFNIMLCFNLLHYTYLLYI